MTIVDKQLKTNLASIGFKQASGMDMGVNAMSMFAGTQSTDLEEGRVLQLLNMVTAEELIDNDEYEGKAHGFLIYFQPLTLLLLRNLRGYPRRMPEIRSNLRHEDTKACRGKSSICRGGKDLYQVCRCGISEESVTSVGRAEICRPYSGDDIFRRGQLRGQCMVRLALDLYRQSWLFLRGWKCGVAHLKKYWTWKRCSTRLTWP